MPHLFSSMTFRSITLRNRIMLSPMCMYSADQNGIASHWHLAHYTARALGGAGLLLTEAAAVEPRGRISAHDLGIWSDAQIAPLARIVDLVHQVGAAIGIQLAHAGRKAWSADRGHGHEFAIAPTAIPFDNEWKTPKAITTSEIDALIASWQSAALRAHKAQFDVIEIHAAHGYLVHQFLSPLSNKRTDDYGGTPEKRLRLLLEIIDATREVWPSEKPVFVRVSATDWDAGGLGISDLIAIARELRAHGVDLIDCSSGGAVPTPPPSIGPGYQVPFSEAIRRQADIATAAVGLVTKAEHADAIVRNDRADLVALGRELLRHPHWPLEAAHRLGCEIAWPKQYERARFRHG